MLLPDLARVAEPPDLSSAELERLAILNEELGEVVQAVGKILRHGYASHHPQRLADNRYDLGEELGHVLWAIQLLVGAKDLSSDAIFDSKKRKGERTTNYLHYQE